MRISEVARRSGVSASALRYYESVDLIHAAREPNGYRSYDVAVLSRLSVIEAAKQLDLPLTEIWALLSVLDGDTCTQVRETLKPRLEQRLREVDEHLKALQQLRDRLATATSSVAECPDANSSCRSECLQLATPSS